MENPLQISKLNDFIFCPHSIYFHGLYENFGEDVYHDTPQRVGKIKHQAIDSKTYADSKSILQGISIYSEALNLVGKIDIYNTVTSTLIERKNKITKIYDGYILQLYAQYFCLKEMGYVVKKLCFHSLADNKRYPIELPSDKDLQKLKDIVEQINSFDLSAPKTNNRQKCDNCIYKELCA